MTGLYPGQKAKPTGRLIFQALAGLRLAPPVTDSPRSSRNPAQSRPGYWTSLPSTPPNHHDQQVPDSGEGPTFTHVRNARLAPVTAASVDDRGRALPVGPHPGPR